MRKILLLSILMCLGMVGYSQNIIKKNISKEDYKLKYYDSTLIIRYSSGDSFNNPIFFVKGREKDTIYYQEFKIPSIDIIKIKSNNIGITNIKFDK